MRKLLYAALAAMTCTVFAADPAGFHLWKATEMKKTEKALSAKLTAQKSASEQLAKVDSYSFMLAHREGSGESELHVKVADTFMVQVGEATLVVGGKMVGARDTGPNEVRGSGIDGGEKHKLVAGDVVTIPANTPHQLLLDPGKRFTYFVVKVESK